MWAKKALNKERNITLLQIIILKPPNMVASILLMVPAPVTVPAPMIPEQMCRCRYRGEHGMKNRYRYRHRCPNHTTLSRACGETWQIGCFIMNPGKRNQSRSIAISYLSCTLFDQNDQTRLHFHIFSFNISTLDKNACTKSLYTKKASRFRV